MRTLIIVVAVLLCCSQAFAAKQRVKSPRRSRAIIGTNNRGNTFGGYVSGNYGAITDDRGRTTNFYQSGNLTNYYDNYGNSGSIYVTPPRRWSYEDDESHLDMLNRGGWRKYYDGR